ncbi:CopG family transcriptional regulator [Actinomycetaceae bacterium MB13-C1-2]|nr:CopG family transcriptional regulator [Actinomycetaceae bacterium MB13-C1-2]
MDGTVFTDEDIERWAVVDESEDGYSGRHLGPPTPGRPIAAGRELKPLSIRIDVERKLRLDLIAAERKTTVSKLIRDLIDSL